MNEVRAFEVGQFYTNDQIRFSLEVENLGGIRPALDGQGNVRHVAILTTADEAGKVISENPYRDRIEGDILTYTAQGRECKASCDYLTAYQSCLVAQLPGLAGQ